MFEFLWKRKDSPAPSAAPVREEKPQHGVAPGTRLHYDPDLVAGLVADHNVLLGIFGEIGDASKQKNMALVKERLGDFGDALRGHLLKENVRFYLYLQHSLEDDPDNAEIMHGFRKEMQHIGRAVADFLNKYTADGAWSEAKWQDFQQEVGAIGKVLVKRIQTEENVLYPLYLPAQDYK